MLTKSRCISVRLVMATLIALFLLLAPMVAASGQSPTPTPSPAPAGDVIRDKLLVIELFFLAVGIAVALFVGYLIWASRRRKKKK